VQTTGPPEALVRSLLDGPSPVAAFEWHDLVDSTNRRATELAAAGTPEITVVAADTQTAGRGRAGRSWTAPAGTSLLVSLVVRPTVATPDLPLLALLTGLVLAETAERAAPAAEVALKWPNDLLARPAGASEWRKVAGVLVEASSGAAVVGIGCNVDWRGVAAPADVADVATSLAEAGGVELDRWRLLAALLGVFGNRYAAWCERPAAFLDGYRARCLTISRDVTARRPGGELLAGRVQAVADSGSLVVRTRDGRLVEVSAGDVTHVR
jgi:BirA family transcriptional regulator, biotin operon repressor / biotin---[acetyl-CoA-carboxylase] ligase